MISYLDAVIIGVLQGIFEWLPVSSQSQVMVYAMQVLRIDPLAAFDLAVFLHLGTALAAMVYFRKELRAVLVNANKQRGFFVWALLGTAITGIPLYFWTRSVLVSATAVTVLIGVLLIVVGIAQKKSPKCDACNEYIPRNGFVTGLVQGLSIIPGISRSGITTSALLLQSFSPAQAFRASFILSVPTVFAAQVATAVFSPVSLSPQVLVAMVVAGLVGFASLGALLKLAQKIEFADFAILFGIVYVALGLLG